MSKFVGERHQRHGAQTRLHVFFGLVFRQSGKDFLKLAFETGERLRDRDVQQFHSEVLSQLLRGTPRLQWMPRPQSVRAREKREGARANDRTNARRWSPRRK